MTQSGFNMKKLINRILIIVLLSNNNLWAIQEALEVDNDQMMKDQLASILRNSPKISREDITEVGGFATISSDDKIIYKQAEIEKSDNIEELNVDNKEGKLNENKKDILNNRLSDNKEQLDNLDNILKKQLQKQKLEENIKEKNKLENRKEPPRELLEVEKLRIDEKLKSKIDTSKIIGEKQIEKDQTINLKQDGKIKNQSINNVEDRKVKSRIKTRTTGDNRIKVEKPSPEPQSLKIEAVKEQEKKEKIADELIQEASVPIDEKSGWLNDRIDEKYQQKIFERNNYNKDVKNYKVIGEVPSFIRKAQTTVGNNHLNKVYYYNDYVRTLFKAVLEENISAIERLLIILKNTEIENKEGDTPLIYAVKNKKMKSIRYLVKRGCDPNYQNSSGDSPKNIALESGDIKLLAILNGMIK